MTEQQRYEIEDVAFIGRTFDEYQRMFDFSVEAWHGQRVLDCPAGSCSFVTEACERGVEAAGADLLYNRSPAELARICTEDIHAAMTAMEGIEDLYRWDFYENVADLATYRECAASRFLFDYAHNGERYIRAELPVLPFPEGAFDLVLSAHFLFLYDDRIPLDTHLEILRELLRVGHQVRVFPLHGLDATQSGLVESVIETLHEEDHAVETRTVSFEFQRGANEMLIVE
jgi:SAM-dependent methyltransferase